MDVSMTLLTLLLAKVFGLYLIIMAIVMLSKRNFVQSAIQKLNADDPIVLATSSSGLLLGLFLVALHNHWVYGLEAAITVLAWFILIKSILWLSMPRRMLQLAKSVYFGGSYYVIAAIVGIIGIILMVVGFSVHYNIL